MEDIATQGHSPLLADAAAHGEVHGEVTTQRRSALLADAAAHGEVHGEVTTQGHSPLLADAAAHGEVHGEVTTQGRSPLLADAAAHGEVHGEVTTQGHSPLLADAAVHGEVDGEGAINPDVDGALPETNQTRCPRERRLETYRDGMSKIKEFSSRHASNLVVRQLRLSFFTSNCVLVLILPIAIWPISDWLFDPYKCSNFDDDELKCRHSVGCTWNEWGWVPLVTQRCKTIKDPSAFFKGMQGMWATMVMQCVFSISKDFGSTVKSTLQGVAGTAFAALNIELLHLFLQGGEEYLPLCSNQVSDYYEEWQHCFLNVRWKDFGLVDFTKFMLIWLDFECFVVLCFLFLDANARIFALSTGTYYMMSFVNPDSNNFDHFPPISLKYFLVVVVASVFSIGAFLVPWPPWAWYKSSWPRFTASHQAFELCEDGLVEMAVLLLRSLPDQHDLHDPDEDRETSRVMQQAASMVDEMDHMLAEYMQDIKTGWFEDFDFGVRGRKRRNHRAFGEVLQNCLRHIRRVRYVSSFLSSRDKKYIEANPDYLKPLYAICDRAAEELRKDYKRHCLGVNDEDSDSHFQSQTQATTIGDDPKLHAELLAALRGKTLSDLKRIAKENGISREKLDELDDTEDPKEACIRKILKEQRLRDKPSSELQAFFYTASGAYDIHSHLIESMAKELQTQPPRVNILLAEAKTRQRPFYSRFVLQSSLAISFAFFAGWIGLWNVLPAYSYYAASTLAILARVSSSGSGMTVMKRVSGVVLGKVIGTTLQLWGAVRDFWRACAFVTSTWLVVCLAVYFSLHRKDELGYVCSLVAAYVGAGVIPGNAMMRTSGEQNFYDVTPMLLSTIISTVLAIVILAAADILLASSTMIHAQGRLRDSLHHLRDYLDPDPSAPSPELVRKSLMEELDELRDLIPHLATVPQFGHEIAKPDMYQSLDRHIRKLELQIDTVRWAGGRELNEHNHANWWSATGGVRNKMLKLRENVFSKIQKNVPEGVGLDSDVVKHVAAHSCVGWLLHKCTRLAVAVRRQCWQFWLCCPCCRNLLEESGSNVNRRSSAKRSKLESVSEQFFSFRGEGEGFKELLALLEKAADNEIRQMQLAVLRDFRVR